MCDVWPGARRQPRLRAPLDGAAGLLCDGPAGPVCSGTLSRTVTCKYSDLLLLLLGNNSLTRGCTLIAGLLHG